MLLTTHAHTHMRSQNTAHFIRVDDSPPILMKKAVGSSDTSLYYQTVSQNSPTFTVIPAPKLSSRFSCNIMPYRLETVTHFSEGCNSSMFRVNLGLLDPQYGVSTLFRNTGNCLPVDTALQPRILESSLTVL